VQGVRERGGGVHGRDGAAGAGAVCKKCTRTHSSHPYPSFATLDITRIFSRVVGRLLVFRSVLIDSLGLFVMLC